MLLDLLLVSFLTFVELNCENLFDCRHDSLRNDTEYLPDSPRHWTPWRYWKKLNNIAQCLIAAGDYNGQSGLPDIIALCEVENDSVMRDLTKRSLLRNAVYEYIVTNSDDPRGMNVSLVYSPFAFAPINHRSLRPRPVKKMPPTRDILYVSGRIITGDTLHIFVVHSPSRRNGERFTRPFRMAVAETVTRSIDSIRALSPCADIIVAGDFNAYATDKSLCMYTSGGLFDVTSAARGSTARGTYRYKGRWGSLDHILMSASLLPAVDSSYIYDAPFLLEEDFVYGGVRPCRTYNGYKYSSEGTSDHLPLKVVLRIDSLRGRERIKSRNTVSKSYN
ncbi:MAG: endonuclease/exonuclease/phosphatase family protein [Prevotella sp.]|nr:endonuclease/exonuclease/phosphatase family protein [Prevotella sp.]